MNLFKLKKQGRLVCGLYLLYAIYLLYPIGVLGQPCITAFQEFSEPNTALETAVRTANKAEVEALIANGANANEALMYSIIHSQRDIQDVLTFTHLATGEKALELAIRQNRQIDQIEKISQSSTFANEGFSTPTRALVVAGLNKNVEISHHLIKHHKADLALVFREATIKGDVELGNFLKDKMGFDMHNPPRISRHTLQQYNYNTANSSYHTSRSTFDIVELSLYEAISRGHKDFVQWLLKHIQRDSYTDSFLETVRMGETDTAKIFIEQGQTFSLGTLEQAIDIVTKSPNTENFKEMGRFLFELTIKELEIKSPRVNNLERNNDILRFLKGLLELVASKGLIKEAKYLVETIKGLNHFMDDAIAIALNNTHYNLAKYLVRQSYIRRHYIEGLKTAMRNGLLEIVEIYLFEKKYKPVQTTSVPYNGFRKELLNVAIRGDIDILQAFLKAGVSQKFLATILPKVLSQSQLKETELLPIIKVLIENNAGINGKNKDGWTALHTASRKDMALIVDLLLEHNANPNAHRYKTVALHLAVTKWNGEIRNNSAKIIQSLLRAGADPLIQNGRGQTPLDIVREEKAWTAERFLLESNGNLDKVYPLETPNPILQNRTALEYAVLTQNVELVANLVELGANVHLSHLSLLELALKNYDYFTHSNSSKIEKENAEKIVDILLTKSDPMFRDKEDGVSELMLVAENGTKKQVESLVNKGHNIHAKDHRGDTVVDYAKPNKHTQPFIKQLLEQKTANSIGEIYKEASP